MDILDGTSKDGLAVELDEKVSMDLRIGSSEGGGGGGGLGDLFQVCDGGSSCLGGRWGGFSGMSRSREGSARVGSFIDLIQFPRGSGTTLRCFDSGSA